MRFVNTRKVVCTLQEVISIMTKRLVILGLAAITFVVAPQALKAADADA